MVKFGSLNFHSIADAENLVAEPVRKFVKAAELRDVYVTAIDPDLADTVAFCEQYKIGLDVSANCVIVEAKRGDRTWYAACMILATDKVDVNGVVRRYLDARKASFAAMHDATSLTGMEYGGITPLGLQGEWPILVDMRVAGADKLIIGSGLRQSKLLVAGSLLAGLSNATTLDIARA